MKPDGSSSCHDHEGHPHPVPPLLVACTHGDGEGVAVWDFVVDDGLDVDGFQLELDGDVDEPVGGGCSLRPLLGQVQSATRPCTNPQNAALRQTTAAVGKYVLWDWAWPQEKALEGQTTAPASVNWASGGGGSYAASLSTSSAGVPLSRTNSSTRSWNNNLIVLKSCPRAIKTQIKPVQF